MFKFNGARPEDLFIYFILFWKKLYVQRNGARLKDAVYFYFKLIFFLMSIFDIVFFKL